MGVEPYLKVLEEHEHIDIIISGRAYYLKPSDSCTWNKRSYSIQEIMLAFGKGNGMWGDLVQSQLESSTFGILRKGPFVIEPLNPLEKCTVYSVSAHTLYEKSHPYILPGPGGSLDLSETKFEQLTDRSVKVSGSKFIPAPTYTVKMEGAKRVGYRAIYIAGVRDPILIGQNSICYRPCRTNSSTLFLRYSSRKLSNDFPSVR